MSRDVHIDPAPWRPAPRAGLEEWRDEFPILSRQVYLASNCLGAAPRGLRTALERYAEEQFEYGEEGWTIWLPWLAAAADRVADLIGAPPGTVTLDSSVTTFQHRIASCLDFTAPKCRVVMSDLDFPSVGYVWEAWSRHGARRVVVQSGDGVTLSDERVLRAIDERTRVVVVSLATYGSGALLNISALAKRAHELGALIVVDAFQAFGVVPIDVISLDVDVLVSGTRKFGMGCGESAFMYVRRGLIDQLDPMLVGWFAHRDPLAFEERMHLADGISRFQLGTPLVLPHYAASAGLSVLEAVGIGAIRAQSLALTGRIIAHADEQRLRVASPRHAAERGGTVCLKFPGAEAVSQTLNAEGFACSYRPASGLRVAPHFYNTADDIDRFMIRLAEMRRFG